MAAWIGQYNWPEERRGLDDEEASRRRMVEFMLGPLIASSKPALQFHHMINDQQPTTLDLLSAATSACPLLNDSSNLGCTHVELEPEMPLPSGWEKCLNLKTGSIYYLNRTTGATSASDPRKQASLNKLSYGADVSSSPTTSELTVEASNEANSNGNAKPQRSLNANENLPKSLNTTDDNELDLNLSLHVGSCPSPKPSLPPREVGILALHPSSSLSPSKIKVSPNAGASSASSSSSSATSSPISASLAFSQRILSSKQLSQHSPPPGIPFNHDSNQSTRFATMKGSSFYGDLHHSLSDYVRTVGEAGRKLAESEELSSSAMVTVACANCLMFVMLSRSNPRCPRCGTNCPEQMDFPQQQQPPLKKARLGFSF